MMADGFERSIRLAAAAALLAFFARRPDRSLRESRIGRMALRCDEEARQPSDPRQQPRLWADLLWSLVTLLLLSIVVYAVLHGADILAELDDLGLVRSAY